MLWWERKRGCLRGGGDTQRAGRGPSRAHSPNPSGRNDPPPHHMASRPREVTPDGWSSPRPCKPRTTKRAHEGSNGGFTALSKKTAARSAWPPPPHPPLTSTTHFLAFSLLRDPSERGRRTTDQQRSLVPAGGPIRREAPAAAAPQLKIHLVLALCRWNLFCRADLSFSLFRVFFPPHTLYSNN